MRSRLLVSVYPASGCEVDICGVLGMHALQLASGTPLTEQARPAYCA
jgi:L-fucose isomerase-like protein